MHAMKLGCMAWRRVVLVDGNGNRETKAEADPLRG
jgi:hypothetical protein